MNPGLLVKVASRAQEPRTSVTSSGLQLTQQDTTAPVQQVAPISSDVPRRRAASRSVPVTPGTPSSQQRPQQPLGQIGRQASDQVLVSSGAVDGGSTPHGRPAAVLAHQSSAPDVRRSPARSSNREGYVE